MTTTGKHIRFTTGGGLAASVSDLSLWISQLYGGNVLKPESMKMMLTPVMMLRVGNIEKSPDAVSGASPRKTKEEMVNYVK